MNTDTHKLDPATRGVVVMCLVLSLATMVLAALLAS
jgi:hypothetical protein